MNCDKYMALSPKERVEMIGQIVHAIQSSNEIFNRATLMIATAKQLGLFEGVVINPLTDTNTETT